jgi:hypothetical protein
MAAHKLSLCLCFKSTQYEGGASSCVKLVFLFVCSALFGSFSFFMSCYFHGSVAVCAAQIYRLAPVSDNFDNAAKYLL